MHSVDELSFLDIFNAIPDVMGLQDTKRRVLMYNEAGYQYLKKSPEEVPRPVLL
jgi:PAS domain-containing protein